MGVCFSAGGKPDEARKVQIGGKAETKTKTKEINDSSFASSSEPEVLVKATYESKAPEVSAHAPAAEQGDTRPKRIPTVAATAANIQGITLQRKPTAEERREEILDAPWTPDPPPARRLTSIEEADVDTTPATRGSDSINSRDRDLPSGYRRATSAPCKYRDPAVALVDEVTSTIIEVNVAMLGAMMPASWPFIAAFGRHVTQTQDSFESKTIEYDRPETPKHFLKKGVGFACKKGMKPESPNQDDFFTFRAGRMRMHGVFDGHGPYGHHISDFAHWTLPFLICADEQLEAQPTATLRRAFRKCHHLLEAAAEQETSMFDCLLSGTTASIVIQVDDKLHIAHTGDSKVVVCRKKGGQLTSVEMTEEHKPLVPEEKTRIESLGGEIRKLEGDIPHRVFVKGRMFPGLAMSRAIGDSLGAPIGIIPDPDVRTYEIREEDQFVLLCSDGVWEFMPSSEAVQLVHRFGRNRTADAAEELAKESWRRWTQQEQGVVDDITAIVAWL